MWRFTLMLLLVIWDIQCERNQVFNQRNLLSLQKTKALMTTPECDAPERRRKGSRFPNTAYLTKTLQPISNNQAFGCLPTRQRSSQENNNVLFLWVPMLANYDGHQCYGS